MSNENLPPELLPPNQLLSHGDVVLRFVNIVPGRPGEGLVPYYHFRILTQEHGDAGHINFRVGDTRHVRLYAGHIGFEVVEHARGRGRARQACWALAPFVRQFYTDVVLTCNPENLASRRTIERLGAIFLEEIPISPEDITYKNGSRRKRRYRWKP